MAGSEEVLARIAYLRFEAVTLHEDTALPRTSFALLKTAPFPW